MDGTESGLAHLINHRLILYQKNEGWAVEDMYEDRDGKIWFIGIDLTTRHILFAKCAMPMFAAMAARMGLIFLVPGGCRSLRAISGWEATRLLSDGGPEQRKFTGRRPCNPTREILASARYCLRPMALSGLGWLSCPRCGIAAHAAWHLKTLSCAEPEWRNSGS